MEKCKKETKILKYWRIYEVFITCRKHTKRAAFKIPTIQRHTHFTSHKYWVKVLNQSHFNHPQRWLEQLEPKTQPEWLAAQHKWGFPPLLPRDTRLSGGKILSLIHTWLKRNKNCSSNHTQIKDVLYFSTFNSGQVGSLTLQQALKSFTAETDRRAHLLPAQAASRPTLLPHSASNNYYKKIILKSSPTSSFFIPLCGCNKSYKSHTIASLLLGGMEKANP